MLQPEIQLKLNEHQLKYNKASYKVSERSNIYCSFNIGYVTIPWLGDNDVASLQQSRQSYVFCVG